MFRPAWRRTVARPSWGLVLAAGTDVRPGPQGRPADPRGGAGGLVVGLRVAADVDPAAGQPGGQAGVLPLLADGQGQLVVGDDDPHRLGLRVDDTGAGDPRRAQRGGDERRGVLRVVDDVDLLAVQLAHDVAHPLAHRPDAGALRVEPRHLGADGDLRAVPGLAGHGDDLHTAVGDLRDLQREELAHQVGVRARDGDLRAAEGAGDRDDVGLDPGAVAVGLPRHLLGGREHRLDLADVDHHDAARVAPLVGLDDAADDVAFLAGVLPEGLLVLGVAQPLDDDLLGRAGRDPAEVGGGVVPLADGLAGGTELLGQDGHLGGLAGVVPEP